MSWASQADRHTMDTKSDTTVEAPFNERAEGAALVSVIFFGATVLMLVREAQTGRGQFLICAAIAAVSCVAAAVLAMRRYRATRQ